MPPAAPQSTPSPKQAMQKNDPPLFRKTALLGGGLIGSSLARVLMRKKIVRHVAVFTRRQSTANQIRTLQIAHQVHQSARKAVEDADLVVFCVPLGAYAQLAQTISPALMPGAVVSDVGSVKTQVLQSLGDNLPANVHLIPGHPVAGTEKSGPNAGFAELFQNRWTVLTPPPKYNHAALSKLRLLWERCGSFVQVMSPQTHDEILALTSHLPHIVAYAMIGSINRISAERNLQPKTLGRFSAGGLRDFTRIADSNPWMWHDIFLSNRPEILSLAQELQKDLKSLTQLLQEKNSHALLQWLQDTKKLRTQVIAQGQAKNKSENGRKEKVETI